VTTGVDDVRTGIQAMKLGADDYLVKPLQEDVVVASLQRALEKKALEKELENYRLHLEEMVAERTRQIEAALQQIEESYEDTLEALGAAIDLQSHGPFRSAAQNHRHGRLLARRWKARASRRHSSQAGSAHSRRAAPDATARANRL
jgi:FixJ family two-component response regulator